MNQPSRWSDYLAVAPRRTYGDEPHSAPAAPRVLSSKRRGFPVVGLLIVILNIVVGVTILVGFFADLPEREASNRALYLPPDTPPSSPVPNFLLWPAVADDVPNRGAAAPVSPEASSPSGSKVNTSKLHWLGMEITQGVQVFHHPEHPRCQPQPSHPDYIFCNNSIPLVVGRHTLVRVYPTCADVCPDVDMTLRLRLLKNGTEKAALTRRLTADTLQRIHNLPLPDLRASLDNSVNFALFPPPDWMEGPITFEVSLVGRDGRPVGPAPLILTREFFVRKPLRIAYLPIESQGLTPPEALNLDYWLIRMYPVPAVEYYPLPTPPVVLDDRLDKNTILRKLLFTYWLYAQYQPPGKWPDQLFGWLPQELFNGGVSDPFWCPNCSGPHSSRVAFGGFRPELDIGGPRILAHEIAHNLGAQHAWSPTRKEDARCFKAEGVDIQVDPAWPYTDTPHIQEFGIDLYSDPPVIYPPAYYDMMAYCAQPWISPYTYRKLFDSPFLQPDAPATLSLAEFEPQTELTQQGTLLVSGVVYPDGTVSRPEIVRLEGAAFDAAAGFDPADFAPPAEQDYCLTCQPSGHRGQE